MPAEQEAISKTQGRPRERHNSRGTRGGNGQVGVRGVWAADIGEDLSVRDEPSLVLDL